ncbi:MULTISPECIES: hypothetical protein [unclassified Mycobacterium]|uniref:hypothetical protein n=1 Tax=unclassified Mycobacterium TaxID=2642494 RepID=UPI0029C8289D|nr:MULTISPECIES: hypothetical protein [unclassified Mycobacterium]
MTTNAIVLIAVVVAAGLVIAATMVAVTYKTRTLGDDVEGYAVRDRAEATALRARQQEAVADDDLATAYACQVEIDIRTSRH